MGEAKRRKKLGIYPKFKNSNFNKSSQYLRWLSITKSTIRKYPYMGVVTMAMGVMIFLSSGGFNSIN